MDDTKKNPHAIVEESIKLPNMRKMNIGEEKKFYREH